jgi:predicted permease
MKLFPMSSVEVFKRAEASSEGSIAHYFSFTLELAVVKYAFGQTRNKFLLFLPFFMLRFLH